MDESDTQTYLIIGGAGLIGGACVERLALSKSNVHCADRRTPGDELPENVRFHQTDALADNALKDMFLDIKPSHIINAINLATIFSSEPETGYQKIIRFYAGLYDALVALEKASSAPIHYLQMGTTGSGGLGFNIPFTHGGKLEDMPIIHKAAFAGITTSMLTLLSRSFGESGRVTISEIKPGLAIFKDKICESTFGDVRLVTAAGGESGHYTREELEVLTKKMGFTTVSRIVDVIMDLLDGEGKYDIISNLNKTIIAPTPEGTLRRDQFIEEMLEKEDGPHVIATGNLGPPSVTRELIQEHEHEWGHDVSVTSTTQFIEQNSPDLLDLIQGQ